MHGQFATVRAGTGMGTANLRVSGTEKNNFEGLRNGKWQIGDALERKFWLKKGVSTAAHTYHTFILSTPPPGDLSPYR